MKKQKRIVKLVPLESRRFKVTYLFFILIIFGLFGRIFNLQVFSASDLQKKARLIQFTEISSLKRRRTIVDKNDKNLLFAQRDNRTTAISQGSYRIYKKLGIWEKLYKNMDSSCYDFFYIYSQSIYYFKPFSRLQLRWR